MTRFTVDPAHLRADARELDGLAGHVMAALGHIAAGARSASAGAGVRAAVAADRASHAATDAMHRLLEATAIDESTLEAAAEAYATTDEGAMP